MPRRGHPEDVYEDDILYEEVDRRRRSRDDRYFDSEFGPRPVREIDERVLRRQRDRSAPDFTRERFPPPRDDDVLPTRYRDRGRRDDIRLERETEEVYARRRTPPPQFRPRRVSRDEDAVFDEVDDRRRRPREKEKVIFEERKVSSPPPPRREEIERDEVVFRKRDRSLPPRRAREDEDIFVERDWKRYESSDSEIVDDEEAVVRRHRRPSRRADREDNVERERMSLRKHSLPPLDDHRGKMDDEEDEEVIIRHRDRSSNRRRGERFFPGEEEREEEIIFEERERSPHRRSRREEFVVRHEDSSPPRRRRDDEVDDVVIRRRSRSIPDKEKDQDEVIVRHQHRPSPRREDGREEIVIRHRDHSVPAREDDREEVRLRTRHRSSRTRDEEDQDDIVLRRRSAHSIDDDRKEVLVRRDKHGRRLSLGTNIEEDEIILRDDGRRREDDIEFRHVRSPRRSPVRSHSRHGEERKEIIIREDDREGRNDVNREIIIRKDEERAPSPESSEPAVIRKPPIVQEVITHHRHIDSYETIPSPSQRSLEERSVTEEIEIKPRADRGGRSIAEEVIFEHQDKERGISPPHQRHPLPGEEEEDEKDKEMIITRTISGGHGREREIIIREEEREREIVPKEVHVGRRYTAARDKRDRLWTELAKDLVVREAIERAGYEFEESDHFYYVFEYLRYDDVERLVDLSEDIRRFRRERIREIRRERETLPPIPVIPSAPQPPPPLLLERAPPREPRLWEPRERFREREVIVEEGRRPRRYREI